MHDAQERSANGLIHGRFTDRIVTSEQSLESPLSSDMSLDDDLDDDYVARLLAEDAKKTSSKYASQGLSAFLPRRRAVDAPKPNTRFLSHIVREADIHNAALKRKEEVEADRRLKALRDNEGQPRKRKREDESDKSKRRRMFRDIVGAATSERENDSGRSERDQRGSKDRDCKSGKERTACERRSDTGKGRNASSSHHRKWRSRSRSRSPGNRSFERQARRHRRNDTLSSASENDEDSRQRKHRSSKPDHGRPRINASPDDLLEMVTGSHRDNTMSVRVRGRGAHKARSGIEGRFAKNYDPAQDVSLDSDHNSDAEDWDLALEAMRDRVKYKLNQADRMREAGFSEKDVSKWEKGFLNEDSRERDLKDVTWSKKGQIREWDAGKLEQ